MQTRSESEALACPFDSPYAISYWWSIGSQPLFPIVFEIFGPNTC